MIKKPSFFRLLVMVVITIIIAACSRNKPLEQIEQNDEVIELQSEPEILQQTGIAGIVALEPITVSAQTMLDLPAVNYLKFSEFNWALLYSDIRIWGWSKDGKIAYHENRDGFERGNIEVVTIYDIINDKILSQEFLFDYDIYNIETYQIVINNFIDKCRENQIEFIQTEFLELPVMHNNQTVDIILEKKESSLSDFELDSDNQFGNIEGFKVIAKNQGRQKTICEISLQRYAYDVFLCGYFLSPFENRALVVVGEYIHIFEGAGVKFSFIGCHLTIGFN